MAKSARATAPKERIDHSVYGTGTVVDVNERYTTIDFDEAGTRKFVTSIVKLAPSDTPAPAGTRRKRKTTKTTKATKTTKTAKRSK